MREYPVSSRAGTYPNIEACDDIADPTWMEISECKFNLFNKL